MNYPRSAAEVLSRIVSNRQPRPALDFEFVPPCDNVERQVAAIWSEVMRIEGLGVHDNFFALGGDSLHMTQIASRLVEQCNVEVSFAEFFDNPTISQLANLIRPANKQPV